MLEFITKYLSDFSKEILLSALVSFSMAIIGFFMGRAYDDKKRRKLKRILGFKKAEVCEVILPIWRGNLEYTKDEREAYREENGKSACNYDYIQSEEAEALLHIQNLCDLAEVNSKLILKSPEANDLSAINNKLFCGGPLANVYLMRIFSGNNTSPFSFKKRFLFGCKPTWYQRDINAPYLEIERVIPPETKGRVFFVEKDNEENEFEEIHIPEGYIMLIKQTNKNCGTHFICFGNSALTSKKAIKCLTESTDIIYDLTKKHKKHFFIILKCSLNGDIDFEKEHILDFTEKMFGPDEIKKNIFSVFLSKFRKDKTK